MIYKLERVVAHKDWDKLVIETYGRPYAFQQQDDCKERGIFRLTVPDEAFDFANDSIPEIVNGDEMGVSFEAWKSRDPKAPVGSEDAWSIKLFWERNFYPDVQMIANDLHSKGLLESGEYLINIDW